MYIVEFCPEDLFRPGATFTATSFDYTLEIGGWPEGIVFTGRGQRVIIENGQAVEFKDDNQRHDEQSGRVFRGLEGLGSAANGLAVIDDHNLELLTPALDTPVRHRNLASTRLYPYVSHDKFVTLLTRLGCLPVLV